MKPSTIEQYVTRFWNYVDKKSADECWPWTSTKIKGYGVYGIWLFGEGHRNVKAHRLAFEFTFGPFDKSLCVCHHCDNPGCCNPNHLFLGTTQDNTADKVRKNRQIKGEALSKAVKAHARRGENHPNATLTEDEVIEIRRLAALGVPQSLTVQRFGVNKSIIGNIIRRVTWKHI